jgi:hypothetical protein
MFGPARRMLVCALVLGGLLPGLGGVTFASQVLAHGGPRHHGVPDDASTSTPTPTLTAIVTASSTATVSASATMTSTTHRQRHASRGRDADRHGDRGVDGYSHDGHPDHSLSPCESGGPDHRCAGPVAAQMDHLWLHVRAQAGQD